MDAMNAGDIVKIALGSGVVAAVVSKGMELYFGGRKEKENEERLRRYSAIRIAVELERFAVRCDEVADEVDNYIRTSEDEDLKLGKAHSQIPRLGNFSEDIDWKLIEVDLCAKILTFRNEIELCQKTINGWWEVCEFERFNHAVLSESAKCGYQSWELARRIRGEYQLPPFDPEKFAMTTMKDLRENEHGK